MTVDFFPAQKRPWLAAAVAFLIGLVSSGIYQIIEHTFLAGLVIGLFAFSLIDFFVLTRYHFKEEGLSIEKPWSQKHYPWSRFRSYAKDKNGLFLSPYPKACFRDRLRGIFLPLLPEDRDQIEESWLKGIVKR